ncbi:MAG TPA: TetR/AcrR family transcriptional regulator [Spirochaetota bacterium]|nr:TetR/AcrR family transcriptional regulator [Spirochaetota bacterium]HPF04673.1 TetR/AcrR family transcriptional regulator [Spirochaetota bacterium]HPJ44221.1 TetR/AcrR family transcriptional regulator [Spirochaetota bacterium]HPR39291.1 TetR/AcrR family transcriptional regulator [Spirochaetota bacterium]HRX46466.1 TetR/AcrR family transcriptional regulator [Spirochaetota bacterium]
MERKKKLRDRKIREQEQRVDEILKAARKVFFSKGFMKTTMDEIAYEAAISKPTIYKFFSTKEDLYFSLILPLMQECLHEMEEVNLQLQLNMFNSGEKLLRSVMNVFFKKYTENPDLFRIGQLYQQAVMLWTIDKKTENSIKELSRSVMDEMRSLLDSAVTRGFIRDVNRSVLTDIILGSIIGITQLQDAKSRGLDENSIEPVIHMTMNLFSDAITLK